MFTKEAMLILSTIITTIMLIKELYGIISCLREYLKKKHYKIFKSIKEKKKKERKTLAGI